MKIEVTAYHVSENTGYSAWVYVMEGTKNGFAHHGGYFPSKRAALRAGHDFADSLGKALRMNNIETHIYEI